MPSYLANFIGCNLRTLSSSLTKARVTLLKVWTAQPEEWHYYKLPENTLAISR
jgi:hypothetical protein